MSSIDNKKKLILARNGTLILALIAATPFVTKKVQEFVKSDAFSDLRGEVGPSRSQVGIEIGGGADIRQYRGQKLMSKARAKRVVISSDRRQFELYDVTNGLYNTEKGPIKFAASEAVWNSPLKTLFVRREVQVTNKDLDLKTSELTFDENKGVLAANKEITGKLGEGQVRAVTFRYNTKTGGFITGPTSWNGMIAARVQDGQVDEKPSKWDIDSKSSKYLGKASNTYIHTEAHATDGEIILIAPKVDHNQKTDVVIGTGGCYYYSPESNLYADKITVYRKEGRAVLEGHVRMLVKAEEEQDKPAKEEPIPEFKLLDPEKVKVVPEGMPKTDAEKKAIDDLRSSETMKKYPTQLYADYIEYFYKKGNRKAHVKGSPQARQDFTDGLWRHTWTETAEYDGEKDVLTLISGKDGKARMKNAYGDDMIADTFTLSTKKDDEEFEGKNMKAKLYSADKQEDRPGKKDPKTSTPPPAGDPKKTGGGR